MATNPPEPRPLVGPILYFRGTVGDRWRLSALFVLEGETEPYDLEVEGVTLAVPPRHIGNLRNWHVWRFDFSVPRVDRDQRLTYGFRDRPRGWWFAVPGLATRPRMAFVSGNGAKDERSFLWSKNGRNERWVSLSRQHGGNPYHVLIQGGNQIYADSLWEDCPALESVIAQPVQQRLTLPFTRAMADQLMYFYFRLYSRTWAQVEVAPVVASIPSVMIWDDHDIFDGWGNLSDAGKASQVARGIFQVARRYFTTFQLGASVREPVEAHWGAPVGTCTHGYRIGDVGIFLPDVTSERTPHRVFSPDTWQALDGWLQNFNGCKHLFIVSAIPMAFVAPGWVARKALSWFVDSKYEDRLRSQWRAPGHLADWKQFVHTVGEFAMRSLCRVTFLSGRIDLGAQGVIRGAGPEMWQLIAAPVVHPPLSAPTTWFLEQVAAGNQYVTDELSVELPAFSESGKRFLRARNWLDLSFNRQNRLVARWHAEGERAPVTHAL